MSETSGLSWAGEYDAAGRPVAFFPDVPARDLSAAEVAALPKGRADELVKSGLYEQPKAPEKKPAKTKDGDD